MPYIGKQPANVPVTADDIPNDSITAAKIVDAAITIDDIGPNAVGNSEMADDAIGLNELSATGTTNTSTFLRGDNSWAVPPNTVYTHPNHSGDVTSSADGATTIANNAVTTGKINDGDVTTAKLAADCITAVKIADDVINATHIEDGQILTAALGDDAVTAAKLANSINTDIATGVTANTTANAALPKTGGTMTGNLTVSRASGNAVTRLQGASNSQSSKLFISHTSSGSGGLFYSGNVFDIFSYGDIRINSGTGNVNDTIANERIVIKNTGLVGIGTSSPSKTLSVHSTSGSAGTPNGLYIYNEVHGSDSQIYMYAENDSGSNQGANIKLDPDAETFSFIGTGGQTAITIADSGNVGIGTTPPSATSNSSYKQLFVNTGGALVDSGGSGPATMVLNNSYIGSGNNNYATATQKAARIVMTSGRLTFDTAPSVSADAQQTFAERMRITDAGKVGIGATTLNNKFVVLDSGTEVDSGSNASNLTAVFQKSASAGTDCGVSIASGTTGNARLYLGDSGNVTVGGLDYDNNDNSLAFLANSSETMRIDSSGTVLINGTASSTARTGGNNSTGDCVITAPALGDNALTLKAPTSHAAGVGVDIVGLNFAANTYYGGSGKSGIYYQIMCEGGNSSYADRGQLRFTPGYGGTIASGQLSNSIVFTYDGNLHIPQSTDGSLSVGTTTAASVLNVNSTEGGSYAVTINCTRNSGSSGHIIDFHENSFAGNRVGTITSNGSSTSYNTSSDYRLKENVDYTWDATTRLKQLKPARFNWIADETNTVVDGFIAHEVQDIVPEAIVGTKDAMTAEVLYVEGDELPEGKSVGDVKKASAIDPQGIDQSKLVPLLVKTIQELEARITALEA